MCPSMFPIHAPSMGYTFCMCLSTYQVKLCGAMKIPSYPHLTFGTASLFAQRGNVSHFPSAHEREPQDLVEWVANLTSHRCV